MFVLWISVKILVVILMELTKIILISYFLSEILIECQNSINKFCSLASSYMTWSFPRFVTFSFVFLFIHGHPCGHWIETPLESPVGSQLELSFPSCPWSICGLWFHYKGCASVGRRGLLVLPSRPASLHPK